jgi:hypothetical protein
MKHKDKSRLERMAFALGFVAIPGPYSVIRLISDDRIATRRDDRPADTAGDAGLDCRPALSQVGWAR